MDPDRAGGGREALFIKYAPPPGLAGSPALQEQDPFGPSADGGGQGKLFPPPPQVLKIWSPEKEGQISKACLTQNVSVLYSRCKNKLNIFA